MARPLIPDTTAFIEVIRRPDLWPAFERQLHSGRVWLSSIVVAELYAGTRSRQEARALDDLVAAMEAVRPAGRLLTPEATDWSQAGRLIGRRIRLHGALRARDHLADVLLLVSAAQLKGEIITANLRHFQAWAELARSSGLDVVVSEALPSTPSGL